MKSIFKLAIIAVSCLVFTEVRAQGNLQFNQVLNITNGQTYTVPAGKVVKVEAINFGLPYSTVSTYTGVCTGLGCYYTHPGINIGGLAFSNVTNSTMGGYNCGSCPATHTSNFTSPPSLPSLVLPIWLASGRTISIMNGQGILLSAIEFNIVP